MSWVEDRTWVNWAILPQGIFLFYLAYMIGSVKGEGDLAIGMGVISIIVLVAGISSEIKEDILNAKMRYKVLVTVCSLFMYYSMFLVVTTGFEDASKSMMDILAPVGLIALLVAIFSEAAKNGDFDGALSKNTNSNASTSSYTNSTTSASSSNKNDKHIGDYDYYYKAKTSNGIKEFSTTYTIEYADDRGTMKVIAENGNTLPNYNDSFSTIQGIIEKDLKDKGMTSFRYNKV